MFEVLLLPTLLALVLGVCWKSGEKRLGTGVVAVGVLAVAAASLTRIDEDPGPRPDAPVEAVSMQRGMLANAEGYVGSATCRACHPAEHASFEASFHPRMTQHAEPRAVLAPFDGRTLQSGDVAVEVSRVGERFLAEIQRVGERPQTVEIVQTTGSHHLQAYWFPTGDGRDLDLLPFCFRVETGSWIPVADAFLLPPGDGPGVVPGQWNETCHGCHATRVEPRLGDSRDAPSDTRVVEFGVRCEACHGPGEEHVRVRSAPWTRYGEHLGLGAGGDDPIVNPADLDPERSAEVCGQCHSVHLTRREVYDDWRSDGHDYRPGDRLRDTRIVVQPRRGDAETQELLAQRRGLFPTTFWPDGVVRVSGREYNGLIDSPCYEHGEGERQMQCSSCHSMHARSVDGAPLDHGRWADDQLNDLDDPDASCRSCHTEFRTSEAIADHTRHQPASAGSSCVNCHMSHTTYGLLKAMRNHTIESPKVATELESGRPNACNLCHLDQSLEWTSEHLGEWFGHDRPVLDDDQRGLASAWRYSLLGDAGVRALMAWHLGWEPAREAGEDRFFDGVLVELLRDDYSAVRALAWRSLEALGRTGGETYDYVGPAFERGETIRALEAGLDPSPLRGRAPLLVKADGRYDRVRIRRLLTRRDRRKVYLGE